jgi:hypothetical protein
LNSSLINAGQPEICSTLKTPNMETPNHNPDITFDKDLYTIEWSDIENVEIDYENYLNDIEAFFKEDFENEILEEDIYL